MEQPSAAAEEHITIDVHLEEEEGSSEALTELRAALAEEPRRIPSRYFYDDRGSELFERICELPEYYQTRTEHGLLEATAERIVELTAAEELVELGSGAATKTRLLLDAMGRAGRLRLYVPMDVSAGTLKRVAHELALLYPELRVHGIVGDFMSHLGAIPAGSPRLVIFLGGTIGNLRPETARRFLTNLHRRMDAGDFFLLGTDLVKSSARLEAAYNDSQGVTAAFNLNILRVVNRLVDGDFDPAGFRHRAFYDRGRHRIEMRLVATDRQRVHLPGLGLELEIGRGEEILTEISTKYDRPRATALLADCGFRLVEWFTDPEELFALSLARRDP